MFKPRITCSNQSCISASHLQRCHLLYVFFLLMVLYTLYAPIVHGENASVNDAKNKLRHLEDKISKLQTEMEKAHDKKSILDRELSNIEKKIGDRTKQSYKLQQDLSKTKERVQELEHETSKLTNRLEEQQQSLAKHIQARYTMGAYQPLKWILNQESPYKISHLLTLYQYLIKARQNLITEIKTIQNELKTKQHELNHELVMKNDLHQKINAEQKKLQQDKAYQSALLKTLNKEIHNQKQALSDYQHDKANLSRLLEALANQSIKQPKYPFAKMRHQLPRPVQVAKKDMKTINQGVLFLAKEGTAVEAIYPGKVVFSDWLKGYGLIIIIDHGGGFMSLYAHNQSLFKNTGELVHQGEQIAVIGHSGGLKENGLYFEVRHRGKAIPPFEWLS